MGKRLITILLVLLTVGTQAFAQSSVSGKVTDKTGEPLVGASVLIKGTTNGTMTDVDGNYSLSGLKSNSVLVHRLRNSGSLCRQPECDQCHPRRRS